MLALSVVARRRPPRRAAAALGRRPGAAGAQQSTSLLGDPPLELTDEPPPGNTTMLAANGEVITSFYEENRAPVAGDQIAQVMKHAMVAIEDARFYEHGGLDVQGTLRALVTNIAAGEVQEGGSTLTQQLVKQTLLQTATTAGGAGRRDRADRSAASSARPGWRWRSRTPTARTRLLTRYLNIVYFGQNAYGVQPAARAFFGVDAAGADPAPGRAAGRPRAEPDRRRPVRRPRGRDGPAQPGADAHGRAGLHHAGRAGRRRSPRRSACAPAPAPRRGCVEASVGAYVCDFVQRYLIQTLRPDPGAARARRLHHPDDAATPSCSAPATPPS